MKRDIAADYALPPELREAIEADVRHALAEDVGSGDLTGELIRATATATAVVISREHAVLCGGPWFDVVYRQLDPAIRIDWQVADGRPVEPDQQVCTIDGPARALLTGERTALNFLQALSGTATEARRFADAVSGTGARVLDTRKTLPGLRRAQKYAVRCGGCHNHRMGLFDAVLIKENHILSIGSIAAAVADVRRRHPSQPAEVEVENLQELEEALQAGADRLLLDNFDLEQLREAVKRTAGRAKLEASGNIGLDNIRQVAETGVDEISVGALTKHLRAVDFSMRVLRRTGGTV